MRWTNLPVNPLDWPGEQFLLLFIGLAIATFLVARAVRRSIRGSAPAMPSQPLAVLDTAYLAEGALRASDTAAISMVNRGDATYDGAGQAFVLNPRPDLPPPLDSVRGKLTGRLSRFQLQQALAPALDGIRDRLAQWGLVVSQEQYRRMRQATLLVWAPVLLLGCAKVVVGMSRGRPVGALVLLLVIAAAIGLAMAFWRPLRTVAGDARLAALKEEHARVMRSPLGAELALGFALAGAAVLIGTPLAAFGRSMPGGGSSTDTDSGTDTSDSGWASSDGGSSSSGCGGCGSSSSE